MNGVARGVKAGIGAMLVCVALLASGCGKDEPKRSALAESLAQLCEQARADTEELGLPAEEGFDVMKPTAARGLRLAADIKKLKGTTPAEKEQIASLAEYFRFYYNELDAAVKLYSAGHPEVYADHARRGRSRRSRAARRSRRAWARPSAPCGRSPTASSRYVPSNSGLRFSTKASTPSWKSWVCWSSP